MMMPEVDAMTFVSSAGGLLGIWTEANIISIIQLFYLFCCANWNSSNSSPWCPLSKPNKGQFDVSEAGQEKLLFYYRSSCRYSSIVSFFSCSTNQSEYD